MFKQDLLLYISKQEKTEASRTPRNPIKTTFATKHITYKNKNALPHILFVKPSNRFFVVYSATMADVDMFDLQEEKKEL